MVGYVYRLNEGKKKTSAEKLAGKKLELGGAPRAFAEKRCSVNIQGLRDRVLHQ